MQTEIASADDGLLCGRLSDFFAEAFVAISRWGLVEGICEGGTPLASKAHVLQWLRPCRYYASMHVGRQCFLFVQVGTLRARTGPPVLALRRVGLRIPHPSSEMLPKARPCDGSALLVALGAGEQCEARRMSGVVRHMPAPASIDIACLWLGLGACSSGATRTVHIVLDRSSVVCRQTGAPCSRQASQCWRGEPTEPQCDCKFVLFCIIVPATCSLFDRRSSLAPLGCWHALRLELAPAFTCGGCCANRDCFADDALLCDRLNDFTAEAFVAISRWGLVRGICEGGTPSGLQDTFLAMIAAR